MREVERFTPSLPNLLMVQRIYLVFDKLVGDGWGQYRYGGR